MKFETQPFDIETKVRQDCYNRGYEQGRKNPAEEIVKYIEKLQNQVKEYQDKIEQGTLIELPIPYGTELHFLWSREHHVKPQPPRVHSTSEWIFNIRSDGKAWLSSNDIPCGYYGEYLHELGKTVFLTREEAEKRLKEIQNG